MSIVFKAFFKKNPARSDFFISYRTFLLRKKISPCFQAKMICAPKVSNFWGAYQNRVCFLMRFKFYIK